jgi:hypothetical protein
VPEHVEEDIQMKCVEPIQKRPDPQWVSIWLAWHNQILQF